MATQVSDLRDRAEVWRAAAREQDNGETVYEYAFQRTVWAAVTPTAGRAESLEGGATRAELTHRVVVREASLPRTIGQRGHGPAHTVCPVCSC